MLIKYCCFGLKILILLSVLQACGGSETNNSEPIVTPIVPTTPSPTVPVTPSVPTTSEFYGPLNYVRIANGQSGLFAEIDSGDRFARDHDRAGDINGDGIVDLVIGARSDDDGATDAGAVYILFMNADGTVASSQKISMLHGNFTDVLIAGSFFGYGVAGIGDYNGDNTPDIAVSAPSGVVPIIYILHLHPDGTIKSMTRNTDIVALGLSAIGDLNQDGKIDLVAANPNASSGGEISLLFLDDESELIANETVVIGQNMGGFGEGLLTGDSFGGRESALLGDIDNNGTLEIAVGAFQSDGGTGAIWILSLDNETYNVVDKLKIGPGLAGFYETIPNTNNTNGSTGGHFGHSMAATGDLNGDGIPDLISGANQYDKGVGYILYLNSDKSVKTHTRLNDIDGGFNLILESEERFSRSISVVKDARTDGKILVNMGGGASGEGAFYSLTFQACTIEAQTVNTFWDEGNTLFTNWNHGTQTVTGPLSYEQCALKAFENNAFNITAKAQDGRCIIKDENAVLQNSDEESQAYVRRCPL